MVQLSAYGVRVVDRLSMMGMWLAVVVSIRNLMICSRQYRRTRGRIHLVNIAQVVTLAIHRFLYGIIPLFEVQTCAYFPLLVSLWHITYLLFYTVMFMRLIILESDRHALWIKLVGIFLITVRFADWPYELAWHSVQENIMRQQVLVGGTCWAQWGNGVIILNFLGDSLANLFLSGMFVRRLYLHIRMSKSVMSRQNRLLEYIARKSLICLICTFIVNLTMNILKITMYLGDRSDAFTVYFELIESTLLVEALRVDYNRVPNETYCDNCGVAIRLDHSVIENASDRKQGSQDFIRMSWSNGKRVSDATAGAAGSPTSNNPIANEAGDVGCYDESVLRAAAVFDGSTTSHPMSEQQQAMRETLSAFDLQEKPVSPTRSTTFASDLVNAPSSPTTSRRRPLSQHPEWSNNDYRMF